CELVDAPLLDPLVLLVALDREAETLLNLEALEAEVPEAREVLRVAVKTVPIDTPNLTVPDDGWLTLEDLPLA
uniref:Uncharacterized protein n=1 Tax=Caenorhabditis japonica TaxID=281687 RepID=A0A8R1IH95_CAEJA